MGKISVIMPITERHDNISELYYEYKGALSEKKLNYEFIFVIDGDFNKAYQLLKDMKNRGENIIIVKLAKQFGEATAISEGFNQASGDVIMTLPAYHQVEIREIFKLIDGLNNGDMLTVRRWPRSDSKLNRLQTKLFHFFIKFLTSVNINDIGCSVRVMKREVLKEINLYGDLHRFLPILANKQGFKVREIDLKQSSREKPVRTYKMGVYIRRLIDLVTVFFLVKFTKKPLRFFGLTGTAVLIPGIILTLYLIFARLFLKEELSNRPLFLLSVLLIVLGIQIFAIGLVGEIIIFTHAKEVKEYTIEEIIN